MKKILNNFITAVIVLLIVLGIIFGFAKIGLQSWTFVLLLIVLAKVYDLKTYNFIPTAVSGILGIFAGFSSVLLGYIFEPKIASILSYIILIILVTLSVSKNKWVSNVVCLANSAIIKGIAGVAVIENFHPILGGYVFSIFIMAFFCYGLEYLDKKKGTKITL